jgi:hypothetical protein
MRGYRHADLAGGAVTDLTNIYLTSGVNEAAEPFVTVSAHGSNGTILVGQMTPAEVRAHALGYLEVAEAADQDAAVLAVVRDLGVDEAMAALIVNELRKRRDQP